MKEFSHSVGVKRCAERGEGEGELGLGWGKGGMAEGKEEQGTVQ